MSPLSESSTSLWRPVIAGWCAYDWANSGYTTLLITVFAFYLQEVVFDPTTSGTLGAVVWAWTIAVSMLIGALLSPIAGAIADQKGAKRIGLAVSALAGGGACVLMALLPTSWTWAMVGCLLAANLALELSLTFYNGFLPEIANEKEINRVSAAGMGWGYLGGGIWLLLAMLILKFGKQWEIASEALLLRCCILLTGLWWIVFTLPALLVLRDARPAAKMDSSWRDASRSSLSQTWRTLRQIMAQKALFIFLIAFLFYNDGVQTVISQCATFALQELQFTDSELVGVILMVQIVAMPGALAIGWLADRLGQKRTLVACLLAWITILAAAWFVSSKSSFWIMALGVAFVLGGTQSVSRAIMGNLTPPGKEASYFGFFNLSGKATSFMGAFLFGSIVAVTGSARLAIVMLLVFFVIGLLLILLIRSSDLRVKATAESAQNPS